ncbi:hypothetical protein GQ42DRAFT_12369 [Ramicandelaber brevisporus]|nr:hypothetical protein GQ42DRAFT_12369 [Ramicandelaber brevisporus]
MSSTTATTTATTTASAAGAANQQRSLNVLAFVRDNQNMYGLRESNYHQYHKFCSNRIQRLRSALGVAHKNHQRISKKGAKSSAAVVDASASKHSKVRKPKPPVDPAIAAAREARKYRLQFISSEQVAGDGRFLEVGVLQAERAWAHAQDLLLTPGTGSSGDMGDISSYRTYHGIRRLRAACDQAAQLEVLVGWNPSCPRASRPYASSAGTVNESGTISQIVDTYTALQIKAYAISMHAHLLFHQLQRNPQYRPETKPAHNLPPWADLASVTARAIILYSELARAGTAEEYALAHGALDKLMPIMRLCAFRIKSMAPNTLAIDQTELNTISELRQLIETSENYYTQTTNIAAAGGVDTRAISLAISEGMRMQSSDWFLGGDWLLVESTLAAFIQQRTGGGGSGADATVAIIGDYRKSISDPTVSSLISNAQSLVVDVVRYPAIGNKNGDESEKFNSLVDECISSLDGSIRVIESKIKEDLNASTRVQSSQSDSRSSDLVSLREYVLSVRKVAIIRKSISTITGNLRNQSAAWTASRIAQLVEYHHNPTKGDSMNLLNQTEKKPQLALVREFDRIISALDSLQSLQPIINSPILAQSVAVSLFIFQAARAAPLAIAHALQHPTSRGISEALAIVSSSGYVSLNSARRHEFIATLERNSEPIGTPADASPVDVLGTHVDAPGDGLARGIQVLSSFFGITSALIAEVDSSLRAARISISSLATLVGISAQTDDTLTQGVAALSLSGSKPTKPVGSSEAVSYDQYALSTRGATAAGGVPALIRNPLLDYPASVIVKAAGGKTEKATASASKDAKDSRKRSKEAVTAAISRAGIPDQVPNLVAFPPALVPTLAKPVFFDQALSYVNFNEHSLAARAGISLPVASATTTVAQASDSSSTSAQNTSGGSGGLSSFLGGWFNRG